MGKGRKSGNCNSINNKNKTKKERKKERKRKASKCIRRKRRTFNSSKCHVVNAKLVIHNVSFVAIQRSETLMACGQWPEKVWGRGWD